MPSAEEIARIPAENLHVSRAEFAAVWAAAEQLAEEGERRGGGSWYTTAVVITCRWVAQAIVRPPTGPGRTAHAPVTRTHRMAYAELIERECLAAEVQAMRRPVPTHLAGRPGWAEGVEATFRWMWRRTGPPPIAVEHPIGERAPS